VLLKCSFESLHHALTGPWIVSPDYRNLLYVASSFLIYCNIELPFDIRSVSNLSSEGFPLNLITSALSAWRETTVIIVWLTVLDFPTSREFTKRERLKKLTLIVRMYFTIMSANECGNDSSDPYCVDPRLFLNVARCDGARHREVGLLFTNTCAGYYDAVVSWFGSRFW